MSDKQPCEQVLEQICDILEFQLGHSKGKEACREVVEHVKNCPTCCAEVETLRKTIMMYQQLPKSSVPRDVHSRLLKELDLHCASENDNKLTHKP